MRQLLSISIVLTIIVSCNNNRLQPQQETPKALDENDKSYSLVTKRGYDEDILESLYGELVDKTPELEKLEEDIDIIYSSKVDSLEAFTNFDSKNDRYYNSAGIHSQGIKDSLLRQKMKNLIQASLTNYNSLTAPHNNLLNSIESKQATLGDVHTALKIVRTLPVIAKYQKNSLPDTKPLEGYSQKLSKTIREAQTLSNK
jgi:Na+-transporting NADH:ubiquinone oxidoreductase subunit NqrC